MKQGMSGEGGLDIVSHKSHSVSQSEEVCQSLNDKWPTERPLPRLRQSTAAP